MVRFFCKMATYLLLCCQVLASYLRYGCFGVASVGSDASTLQLPCIKDLINVKIC